MERNLQDAMGVARNVFKDPRLVPGGGAVEMAVARELQDTASTAITGSVLFYHPYMSFYPKVVKKHT